MSSFSRAELLGLSVSERILLVEDIWDSIAESPETLELIDEQKAEVDLRLEAYHRDPSAGSPWSDVIRRLRSRA